MKSPENEFSFYDLFIPLTTKKIVTFIILIGFIVYGNGLFGNFIWDDKTFILFNPDVRNLNLSYLLGANMFNNVNAGQYRFFVALYFTILHTCFGDTTFFYHLFQIIIHITNTILVFFLFHRFFQKGLSFFLSLLFLIHPIQVESVSYIASSGNPLFVLFGLLALVLTSKQQNYKKTIAIFTCLLFSLFSKETGIFFILLVLFYHTIVTKQHRLVWVGYAGITIGMYAFVRFAIAGVYFSKVELAPITRLTFFERLINTPAVIFYYLKTFVFPLDLYIEQYWIIPSVSLQTFYLPLVITMLCFGIWVYVFWKISNTKKLYPFLFFSLWFFTGLGAYSQVISLDMTVAERWFYFPIIGLLALIGFAIQQFFTAGKKQQTISIVLSTIIIVSFSLRTMIRNSDWQDAITLYTHDSALQPNYDIENSLGGELSLVGRQQEALIHYKKSVKLFPHETNLFNLGLTYDTLHDKKNALLYYQQALLAKSYDEVPKPHMHHNVTYIKPALLLLSTQPAKAYTIVTNGLTDYPTDPDLWYIKTLAAYSLHHTQEALQSAEKLVQLIPNNTTAQSLRNTLEKNQQLTMPVQ